MPPKRKKPARSPVRQKKQKNGQRSFRDGDGSRESEEGVRNLDVESQGLPGSAQTSTAGTRDSRDGSRNLGRSAEVSQLSGDTKQSPTRSPVRMELRSDSGQDKHLNRRPRLTPRSPQSGLYDLE